MRYRLAVLACYAAGTPTADAAAHLGWPKGTLLTRLAWARRRRRKRLDERGLAPAAFAVAFAPRAGRVGAAALADRIAGSALLLSTGDPLAKVVIPGRVASLTEGVVRAMIGTQLKVAAAAALVAVALLGLGLGRMTADGQTPAAPKAALPGARVPAAEAPRAAEAEPGDLIVRRPKGSYTREVPGVGKVTLTFDAGRLSGVASVRLEETAFVASFDGDYALNAESVVFGVVASAEVEGAFDPVTTAAVANLTAGVTDMPFAFRVRVEDDAVTVKDVRFGALGSPAFEKAVNALARVDGSLELPTVLLTGKYRADPNPVRPTPPPAAPGGFRPRTRRTSDAAPVVHPPGPYGPQVLPGTLQPPVAVPVY